MEEYSSGRRGVTRNLVGLLQGARVQIPSPPPNKKTTLQGGLFIWKIRNEGFEQFNASVRWTLARCRLDGSNTLIPAKRECNKSLLLRRWIPPPIRVGASF